jgi:methenyltetrahydromethanopterin cyclohydrolase
MESDIFRLANPIARGLHNHMNQSVNENALKLVEKGLDDREKLRIIVETGALGCTIIDTGIKTAGGYSAGKWVVEISLGGYGSASLSMMQYGELLLPSIFIETGYPAIATLGSQLAGWSIRTDDYSAMGSGPARALSKKPKELYGMIQYSDHCESAVIVLEADSVPTEKAIRTITTDCQVSPKNLYVIMAPTSSIVGSVQISGRIVETGIHRLGQVGLDPRLISFGCGSAPIAPVHAETTQAIGRTNDALYYGGVAFYTVACNSDEQLRLLVSKSSSRASNEYGRPFHEILKAAGFDFYRIDPRIFAPSVIMVTNSRTGTTFKAGEINVQILKKTMGVVNV